MLNNGIEVARRMRVSHNVSLRVLDKDTLKVVQEHTGHNAATNSLLTGIGYYLTGESVLNQGASMLKDFVPQYISLGTMGLAGQGQDEYGLPIDIGYPASSGVDDTTRYTKYADELPGYGADGYDSSYNNSRPYFGLGYPYTTFSAQIAYPIDARVTYEGILYRCISPTTPGPFNSSDWLQVTDLTTTGFEILSPSYSRSKIAFRDVVPEIYSEQPTTLDIVFSAMVSTGALAQFRGDNDYVFITEAGLWSQPNWVGDITSNNGMLAGYRIMPPDKSNWDMSDPTNREILQKNILRVGLNQVVQIIWKIQLGSIDDFVSASGEVQPVVNAFKWHIQGAIDYNTYPTESPSWS